ETTVATKIVGQLGCLAVVGKWPERPPDGAMRGVDFYSATALMRALALCALLFKVKHGYLPNLVSPATFSEHIFLRKFFAPLPIPSLADKLEAYDYVKARVGFECLPSVVWIGDNAGELLTSKQFVGRFV